MFSRLVGRRRPIPIGRIGPIGLVLGAIGQAIGLIGLIGCVFVRIGQVIRIIVMCVHGQRRGHRVPEYTPYRPYDLPYAHEYTPKAL